MRDQDDLGNNIPPLVPDRDDVDSHLSNKRARSREIVRPSGAPQTRATNRTSWPVLVMICLLTLGVGGGLYGAYYFYTEIYQTGLRQANLRISDLETRLAIVGESAEETDNSLMEDINQTIEQYDLLWANWRNNNRQFADIQSEIARLKQVNEGQDELTAQNTQQLAQYGETLTQANSEINALENQLNNLGQTIAGLDSSVQELSSLRADVETIRQNMNSGDDSLLGLAGRLEYIEESMESVNAHRLQINESLYRLQEDVESLQRTVLEPGA